MLSASNSSSDSNRRDVIFESFEPAVVVPALPFVGAAVVTGDAVVVEGCTDIVAFVTFVAFTRLRV
jgi:hypothetical protein